MVQMMEHPATILYGGDEMEKTETTVRRYFEDEKVLLEDWYRDFFKTKFPGEPVAVMPNLSKIRDAFKTWAKDVNIQLFNLICVEWNYPEMRKNRRFEDRVRLAAALADFLISCTWKVPAPIATATLLVQMGLDKVCNTYLEGGS